MTRCGLCGVSNGIPHDMDGALHILYVQHAYMHAVCIVLHAMHCALCQTTCCAHFKRHAGHTSNDILGTLYIYLSHLCINTLQPMHRSSSKEKANRECMSLCHETLMRKPRHTYGSVSKCVFSQV